MTTEMTPEERVLEMFRDQGQFYFACKEGDLKTVKLYLEKPGFNPVGHDQFAFQHAVVNKQIEVVRILMLDPRFDPSFKNNQALTTTINGNLNGHLLFQIRILLLHDERVMNGNSDVKTRVMIDHHVKNRNRKRFALIFVGKTVGQGWADIVTYAQDKLDF